MVDINLSKEYRSTGESVEDLFGRREEGFFVPHFQRNYTWETDNINQLFDDLVIGVQGLSENNNMATFLGTTILLLMDDASMTVDSNVKNIEPTAVLQVIDGQQRIATISLLSVQIIANLRTLLCNLPNESPYDILNVVGEEYINRLKSLYTVKLGRGASTTLEPKIIRAGDDKWTPRGAESDYTSPIARCISTFIRTDNISEFQDILEKQNDTKVFRNVKLLTECLVKVCEANINELFPVTNITENHILEYVLGNTTDDVKSGIKNILNNKVDDPTKADYCGAASYQLMLLSYYLLHRCGVIRLLATQEEWGFDMFQALNATGTRLTALETFRPQVIKVEENNNNNIDWDKSMASKHLARIDKLIEVTKTNEQKNKRTNDLLSAFALRFEGHKLSNKFSEQRKWLTEVYEDKLPTYDNKLQGLGMLANTADFYYYSWYMDDDSKSDYVEKLGEHKDKALASLLIQYLRNANSRLSAPILSHYFRNVDEDQGNIDEFVQSVKACAAFFTLWRSAVFSTSGLDDIYRSYFKNYFNQAKKSNNKNIVQFKPGTAMNLRSHFLDALKNKGIEEKGKWITVAKKNLLYTELKTVCRFMLFLAGHDRKRSDSVDMKGLSEEGINGICPLLTLNAWKSYNNKSIEHVAPQKPPEGHAWDKTIYTSEIQHQVGNLILLPSTLNNFAGNNEWAVKFVYYSLVGNANNETYDILKKELEEKEIKLSKRAINNLINTIVYSCSVAPILSLEDNGKWNAAFINKRTDQILNIAGDKLFNWLVH